MFTTPPPQSDQQKLQALQAAYAEFLRQIEEIKKEETEVPELNLNAHQYAKLKRGILNSHNL
ncbi:hypothetical protein HYW17_02865 [Candidatus Uhrbacteria bacterium]|nr:hypothetical protein [Candidatus Uhrbacteria bacterium]